jgi:hypothetical protein
MANMQKLDTHHKALTLNLDPSIFGSFAEIGAGQEVARWFLLVRGASGTVAKAISAYDKAVSDDLYRAGSRYVSKRRVEAMLDKERAAELSRREYDSSLAQELGRRTGIALGREPNSFGMSRVHQLRQESLMVTVGR